ncbi:MBL fold metallo-hydrolase [Bacillus sp. DJP31]|uniref:MBL fold metallo-hydrolase n=1 Tax=Bacillus sp. DJP31 TaxID=3409789 RepID=UPI003BB5AD96
MIQFQNEKLTVFQSALFQTTCTVVEARESIIVVDPNWLPHEIEEIQKHVARIQGEKELYLLFTHGDFDHVIGYKAFPGARVIGRKGLQEHPEKELKVSKIHQFYHDYYIQPTYPIAFPEVDIVIEEDGQKLALGEITMTFYLAPGHTHDGLFTIIEPLGLWVAGDYLSDFELPFIYQSAKAYGETLQKASQIIENHKISSLVPGHGKTTANEVEINRRIKLSQKYLERMINAVMKDDHEALLLLEKELPFPSNFTKYCHSENISIIHREYIKEGIKYRYVE